MAVDVTSAMKYIVAINCFELVVGFIGNVISCLVILCSKSMHSITEFYLLSLSVSDLMILTTGVLNDVYVSYNPGENFLTRHIAANIIREWIFETSVNASIFTVTAFTVERYLAICHPFFVQSMDKLSRFKIVIIIIWLTAALFAIIPVTVSHFSIDSENLPPTFATAWPYMLYTSVIVDFVLPLLIIIVLYVLIWIKLNETSIERQSSSQAERERTSTKALKMFAVIILIFFISWAPYYAEEVMWYYKVKRGESEGDSMVYVLILKLLTYTLSSALNPIIYVMMSRKFRQAFKELVTKWTNCCSKKRTNTVPVEIS